VVRLKKFKFFFPPTQKFEKYGPALSLVWGGARGRLFLLFARALGQSVGRPSKRRVRGSVVREGQDRVARTKDVQQGSGGQRGVSSTKI